MGSLMTASTANAPCFAKGFLAFYIFNLQIGQQSGVRKTVVKKATGGSNNRGYRDHRSRAISISREMSAKGAISVCASFPK
jgi:hypothetical protein